MGRPRSFDREQALDTAMRVFWERGYAETSVADLTARLGISAPSLYAAFGDKRTLFEEAVARYEASPESVTTAGTTGTTPREVLEKMLDSAAREYVSDDHPRGCLVNSSPELAANREHNREITATRLREVADDDALNAEALSSYVHSVLMGMSSLARDGAGEDELRRVADVALLAALPAERARR
ncbi:TetR/AcrR family transcriptional regulator [Microbacterium sp. Leaf320]|uniref:TetR/AcrR family transcriptional regulator n=1 Tax=Microbacterium sp. Leaf320 TaxID=1736334 RepID=UPI0019104FD9|nr:TetR/AcrR family transcriptional regulator [Microbacterium sp. Leaf320]